MRQPPATPLLITSLRRAAPLLVAPLLVAPLLVAGCEGDEATPPVIGTFEVTRHTLAEGDCEAPAPVDDPMACDGCAVSTSIFQTREVSWFGQSIVVALPCSSAEQCEAPSDPPDLTGVVFERALEDAWSGTAFVAASSGAECAFSVIDDRLAPLQGGAVRFTRTRYTLVDDAPSRTLSSDDCQALAERPPPADELACTAVEEVEGAPIP